MSLSLSAINYNEITPNLYFTIFLSKVISSPHFHNISMAAIFNLCKLGVNLTFYYNFDGVIEFVSHKLIWNNTKINVLPFVCQKLYPVIIFIIFQWRPFLIYANEGLNMHVDLVSVSVFQWYGVRYLHAKWFLPTKICSG